MSKRQFTSAECPNCETTFDRLPLDYDEDGIGTAVLEVHPCALCGALLCPCCGQFQCDGCDETFCSLHMVIVPDGTPKPLRCCPRCAFEGEIEQLPLALPPGRELTSATGGAAGWEVA